MRWSPPTSFIAVCWAPEDGLPAVDTQAIEQRLAKADFRPVFRAPGMLIGVRNANAPHLIMRKFGEDVVVLGSLLRQGSLAPLADLTEPHTCDPRAWARRLAVQAWGRYIAFFRSGGRWWLMRDPSGAVECLRVEQGALRFYGSWAEDLRPFLTLATPAWAAIHEFLLDGRLPGEASALQGVRTVAPGRAECVTTDEAIQAWRPESLIRNEDGATAIPDALRLNVRAAVELHDRVGHQLSGGIDSSCVLACLAECIDVREVDCWTFYSADASEEDERRYARAAAAHLGVVLNEFEMRADEVDWRALFDAPLTARPSLSWLSFTDARLVSWQGARSATALLSGEGGDHLLLRSHAGLFVVDWARLHGLTPRLLTLADASARISGASYWSVLGRGIAEGLLRMPSRRVSSKEDATDIIMPRQDHRRVDDGARSSVLPGKRRQIAALGEAREYLNLSVLNAALDGFPPMLAQPFVEACLATPTYRFGASGYDRTPLRDGFAPMLPEEVRRRRSKAGMTRYYCDGILRNLPYARELLLDGALVREGLVDRARLARALRPDVIISRPPIDTILALVVAETWLARWRP